MKVKRIIQVLILAALTAGCFKKVAYDTACVLKPLVQPTAGAQVVSLADARFYAYAVDTASWKVASYEDALAGIITNRYIDEQQQTTPDATGEPYALEGAEGLLRMSLKGASFMLIAVDPADSLYAYTQQTFASNLPQLYLSVTFKPYREGKIYRETANKGWVYCDDFYVQPDTVSCSVRPLIQEQADADPVLPAGELDLYAYLADTTEWRIASYQDAAAYTITSKSDETQRQTKASFRYSKVDAATGLYTMPVFSNRPDSLTLMIVLVDKTDRLYAYSQQRVDVQGDPVEFGQVVFRTWQTDVYLTEEPGGWRVVNDAARQPETPSGR